MKLWYLGDSVLSSQLANVCETLGFELVDSSKPNATMEEVWTQQVHEPVFRKRVKPECHAVLFLNVAEYDSECLIGQILQHASVQNMILIALPHNSPVIEGMTAHWTGDNFIAVGVDGLDEVTQALTNAF